MNSSDDIFMLSVGNKSPFVSNEGLSIYFDNCGYTLITSLTNLTQDEINAFRSNKITINLCKVDQQVAFFHIRIDGFYDGDVAFSILKSGSTIKDMCTENGEYANLFSLVLVESTTNTIAALRTLGVSQDFAKNIYNVCKEQTEYGLHNYLDKVLEIQAKYTSEEVVKKFSVSKYISNCNII